MAKTHLFQRLSLALLFSGWLAGACVLASEIGSNGVAETSTKAGVPREVRYGGVLQDAAGVALSGVQGVTFARDSHRISGTPTSPARKILSLDSKPGPGLPRSLPMQRRLEPMQWFHRTIPSYWAASAGSTAQAPE